MPMMLKAQMDTVAASEAIDSGRMPKVMQQAMEQLAPTQNGGKDGVRRGDKWEGVCAAHPRLLILA